MFPKEHVHLPHELEYPKIHKSVGQTFKIKQQ